MHISEACIPRNGLLINELLIRNWNLLSLWSCALRRTYADLSLKRNMLMLKGQISLTFDSIIDKMRQFLLLESLGYQFSRTLHNLRFFNYSENVRLRFCFDLNYTI